MKRMILLSALLPLLLWSLPSCAPAAPPVAEVKAPAKPAAPAPKTGWEAEWAEVLAKAKNEGTVSVSTTWKPEMTQAVAKAFRDKHGIDVEFSLAGRGAEQVAKIKAEQRAGLFMVDFFGGGSTTALNLLKPEGLLGSLEALLILPEVKDPKAWLGGGLPFLDKEKQFMALLAQKQIHIIYNTDQIRKGELETYRDALRPQYKGKITINDPSVTGAGASFMTHLAHVIWTVDEAREYLKQLVRDQQAVIQRDNRLAVETVARGKFAVGLGVDQQNLSDFLRMGAPLDGVYIKGPISVSPGSGGISAANKLAHPNAARVFLNWLLSKEGLTAFSGGAGTVSGRTDVTVEGVHPLYQFRPGEELSMQTEEKAIQMGEMIGVAKQAIEEALKK
ncbi:MAG: extracellular solute-binding protein [Chloroflexi bacterium]|nr:extracellular solute-binding protein [Chloroflexota bacterium]